MQLQQKRSTATRSAPAKKRRKTNTLKETRLMDEMPFTLQVEAFDLLDVSESDIAVEHTTAVPADEGFHADMENLATFLSSNNSLEVLSQLAMSETVATETAVLKPEPTPKEIETPLRPPKGYVSNFNFYFKEKRAQLQAERSSPKVSIAVVVDYKYVFPRLTIRPIPQMSANALNKFIGDLWNQLSSECRQPYDALAAADKRRYRTELSAYNAVADVKIAPRINAPPGYKFPEMYPTPMRPLTAYSIFAQQVNPVKGLFISKVMI